MLSALIRTELTYPAMLLAEQLAHQRFVRSGPLVTVLLRKTADSRGLCNRNTIATRTDAELETFITEGVDYIFILIKG